MSIKDLRGPAASALVQPSNALIAVGGLGFFGWVACCILILIPTLFPIDNDDGDKTQAVQAGDRPGARPAGRHRTKDLTQELKVDPDAARHVQLFGVNLSIVRPSSGVVPSSSWSCCRFSSA